MLEKQCKVEEHSLRLPRITIKRNTLCFKWVENGIVVFVRGQTSVQNAYVTLKNTKTLLHLEDSKEDTLFNSLLSPQVIL